MKKKNWANFQRIIDRFIQKIVIKLSKIWVWDPGFGKNLFRIPDLDPQHCLWLVDPDPDPANFVIDLQDGKTIFFK